jgi:hypothetical protein
MTTLGINEAFIHRNAIQTFTDFSTTFSKHMAIIYACTKNRLLQEIMSIPGGSRKFSTNVHIAPKFSTTVVSRLNTAAPSALSL